MFAMMEAQLMLARITQKFFLHHDPSHVAEPEPVVTLRPKYGMRMTLTPSSAENAS